jgi:hypothetical protein
VSTLQIDLDKETSDALASLAASRRTAPADLVAKIVAQYVKVQSVLADEANGQSREDSDEFGRTLVGISIDEAAARLAREPRNPGPPPDPIDALVGSLDGDPVNDIDEVVYGR